ncbi:putative proteinase inhibitor I3, Kunitz legume, kunitz inhibitor STI-like superfamily [Helianthus annuus]|uniref:Uncharacterized protein n=1 Tax=Helianthus annuus TaxID=4232 RepID=A0A9K3EBT2_HELAN|nr:trypsin inhibitor DE-3-like [Helianthus annuus]KAF5770647.1 putative proteinase inhibitor I3, Kunitz legume, kunitz inhibitor STI-like superfamily [Helianthus annuus]KAJ0465537.1 putative proteinase inhibitor I3, Kunitz legume, kunitz inhibitor STI-like superfamily [Helianthus annuus]KAJ0470377.1 putative proteinase inhibitor I3, Kunitz legume, kunitz inhibitor STI-like superfamily [Helianthus annuus]KAJ0487130.1 putative proteinase inhibitor I3, Kunitz legume, kunitz inhibitor STI-like supe
MKSTILSYAAFLLVLIFATQSIPPTTGAKDFVYDVTGEKVLNDAPYSIGPVIWAKGGGIKLTDTKNNKKICPSYVVQDPAEVNKGGKFLFTLISDNEKHEKYLQTSHILGIDSGRPKNGSCEKWTFWQISDPEAKPPSSLVTTGGTIDDGPTCFQVVDYPKPTSSKVHSYMLQHCPYYCGGTPPVRCYNVSLYQDKGTRHLSVSRGTPFEFVFQKAK